MMFPKAVKKFLMECWFYKEEELKPELIADHYIVWACGIDHVVDRTKEPETLIAVTKFERYTIKTDYKKKTEILIFFKEKVRFFYDFFYKIIEAFYGRDPFEMRIIRIPDGMYYLEIKLDKRYSYVFQQVYELDEDERKELEKFASAQITKPRNIPFNEMFTKITIGDDMVL